MKLDALDKPFVPQDTGEELAFVVGVKDPERQMNQLRFVDEEHEIIFTNRGPFYLVPFEGHTLARVDLHDDLLTADLVRKLFKKHFALVKLCDAIKLYPPEKHIQAEGGKCPDKPPYTWNPNVTKAYDESSDGRDPTLPLHHLAESEAYIRFLIEFVIFRFNDHKN